MSASKIFLYFCLSFIIGVLISSVVGVPRSFWLGILILGTFTVILTSVSKSNLKIIVLGFCLLFLVGGIIRHQSISIGNVSGEITKYYDQEVSLKGIIVDEPERRINHQKIQIKTEKIPGKILITTELYPEYKYGDELEIKGKLRKPVEFEDFNYQAYLAKDKIYLVAYRPYINLIAQNKGSLFFGAIFSFKNKLRNIIDQTLLPHQSSVLKAIFLGDKFGLSDELKEKLNISGTRHIVAISGMHMIIMTQIFLYLALAIGLWRSQAFYAVLFLLFSYIIMIGAPASAIRAGIMAGLLLLAQKVGRLRSADRAVVFAATVMLMINPSLLSADVGFQLSFVAVLSIIYLKPILDKKIIKWPNFTQLKDVLTMTLAAQLGTLPILIFHFGRISLISPLANLMIVPLLPVIMGLGMIIVFIGLVYLPLAKIVVWPIWFLLSYLIKTIEYLSSFPWAAYEFKNISWVILTSYYVILIYFIWRKQISRTFLKGVLEK